MYITDAAERGLVPIPVDDELVRAARAIPMFARSGEIIGAAIVDLEDYDYALWKSWHLGRDGYAYRNRNPPEATGRISMHRDLLKLPGRRSGDTREVDHINGKKLDNRKDNLRIVNSRAEQLQNIAPKGRSQYRGVAFHKNSKKWRARCQVNGVIHYLGYYQSEQDAAAAAEAFRRERMPYSRN